MKLIKPSFKITSYPENILENIEKAARTCYKSEDNICEGSAEKLVKMLLSKKHLAMIEFGGVITVKLKIDRSMANELVRHRLASFAQESQRYVRYNEDIEFVIPDHIKDLLSVEYERMHFMLSLIEKIYHISLNDGNTPQEARYILPNCTATEINIQANIRQWLYILDLRCSKRAYPPLRKIMLDVLNEFYNRTPVIFDELYKKYIGETNI